ncbi:MAG: replicative DNA helicase [Gammaproteobacteria bacterium]
MSDSLISSRPTDLRTAAVKVPPHSLEAEQAVLGGLMLNNSAWDRIADQVGAEDFYRRQHQLIFTAVAMLADSGQPFDVVTLSERLSSRGELADAGDMAYLSELAQNTPSAANIVAYANIVRERALLRGLIEVGGRIADSAFRPDGREARTLLEQAEGDVFAIAERGNRNRSGFQPIGRVLEEVMVRVEELYESKSAITGVTTGFTKLDEMTSGLQRSDLVIVAGRPSMGKCVVTGTRLVDPGSGRMSTIDEMVASSTGEVLTLDEAHRICRATPSSFVDDGHKPVFRVRTRSGREIETTATHPFLTTAGWRPLAGLAPGDAIGVPRRLPVFGRRDMPDAEAVLLGYFVGDGELTQASPQLTNTNDRVRRDFTECIATFPDVRCSVVCHSAGAPTICVTADESAVDAVRSKFAERLNALMSAARLTGRGLSERLGIAQSTVSYWRQGCAVPAGGQFDALCDLLGVQHAELTPQGRVSASQSGPNGVAAWLQAHGLMGLGAQHKRVPAAVFELPERTLALFINRLFACDGSAFVQNDSQAVIDYACASEGLALDLRHLLLRFGVLAQLRRRHATYAGERRPRFHLRITHRSSIETFAERIGIFAKEEAIERVRACQSGNRRHGNADSVPASFRAPVASGDVYWDPIESIDYQGIKQVYDLTVPRTHNFIADDVCVHNTSFAMNLVEQAAIKEGITVGVFSLEMPAPQLAMRMLSSLGRVDQHKVRTGRLSDADWPRISSALSMLNETRIFIDDTPGLTPTELRARCRRLKRESDLGMIVIDYLQLMNTSSRGENRATEISEISRSLKALAKEINVPVIALSQLNRSLEQRTDKRPVMSDLRESGAIEQDADVILFIYRDEVYNENSEHKGTAEIIVSKQRNGPIGKVTLTFLGQHTRFENFAVGNFGGPGAYGGPPPDDDPEYDGGFGSFDGPGGPDDYGI